MTNPLIYKSLYSIQHSRIGRQYRQFKFVTWYFYRNFRISKNCLRPYQRLFTLVLTAESFSPVKKHNLYCIRKRNLTDEDRSQYVRLNRDVENFSAALPTAVGLRE